MASLFRIYAEKGGIHLSLFDTFFGTPSSPYPEWRTFWVTPFVQLVKGKILKKVFYNKGILKPPDMA